VAQGVSPEFKPQYCKTATKTEATQMPIYSRMDKLYILSMECYKMICHNQKSSEEWVKALKQISHIFVRKII
jgi:hypothetical protein